ncbi:MAG: hypothetical protein EZS28_040638, partial [Streblomastix strix]
IDGKRILDSDTPETLELHNQDKIDAQQFQDGQTYEEADYIHVQVEDQNGFSQKFKLVRTSKMQRLMNNFARLRLTGQDKIRIKNPRQGLRFYINEKEIEDDDTPASLDLHNFESISVQSTFIWS